MTSLMSAINSMPVQETRNYCEKNTSQDKRMSLMDAGIAIPHASRIIPRSGRSLVAVERFIHATRDSGYKSTTSAVAELVDNAVQAMATEIAISIATDDREGIV